jgi:8-oxo-dGTP diphosphatase
VLSIHEHELQYRYRYPHPAVATDIAVFTLRNHALDLLLIRRGAEPFKGLWALPGGFLGEGETLDQCAARELREETGLAHAYLRQFANFSAPSRDPRERVISVAYLALVPDDGNEPQADTDADEAGWFPVDSLPELAFDHDVITGEAIRCLRSLLETTPISLSLMPTEFSLSDLQQVHEAILGQALDKRNFRKKVIASGTIAETGNMSRGAHRPARLYRSEPRTSDNET